MNKPLIYIMISHHQYLKIPATKNEKFNKYIALCDPICNTLHNYIFVFREIELINILDVVAS